MRHVFEGISFDQAHLKLETKPSLFRLIQQNPRLIIAIIITAVLYPIYLTIRTQRTLNHWWTLSRIGERIEATYWRIDYGLDSTANLVQLVVIGLLVALISPLLELTGVSCV